MCFDTSKIRISGGKFDVLSTRIFIEVRIPKNQCRDGPYDSQCITTREFDESISSKYLTLLTNQGKFDQKEYAGTAIIKNSKATWS